MEGNTTYQAYFEIYRTKAVNSTNRYCLIETNKSLTRQPPQKNIEDLEIPLIQFNDYDRDGMMDLLFYHDKGLQIHFNLLKPQTFNSFSINDSGESLCYRNNETKPEGPIFADVTKMSEQEYRKGGNHNITIQELKHLVRGYEIVDIGSQFRDDPFNTPGRVRAGDLNIDGYPDVYLTLKLKKIGDPDNKISVKSLILINIECTSDDCIT